MQDNSDQGAQYTSHEYHSYIESCGIIASMSRPGTPIDNAPIESFFSTLKAEWLPDTSNMTIEEIAKDIDEYIEFYNNERIQLRTKMSPFEYRQGAA
ncbi:IS3 family transposase [Petrocella atlantisensis]